MSINSSKLEFSWYDYGLFLLMLILSSLIGIYFGFIKKQSTAKDYLFGGKEMNPFLIAMSLVSSVVSGITLLALPVDVYRYGINWSLNIPMLLITVFLSYYLCVPIFYNLQVTSTYEYLEMRFDRKVRIYASICFTLSMFLYLPIIIYIPAMALSQATGINIFAITPIICGVCVFYTTFGGLKAVVWTDALQLLIMFGTTSAILLLGISSSGGLGNIWQKNLDYRRLHIDFSFDITKRDSFWAGAIGGFTMWFSYAGSNQGYVKKCIALPNYKSVGRGVLMFACGATLMMSLSVLIGLNMFGMYSNCDPLLSGHIKKPDELLPYYIMDVAKTIPGIPGLFTVGIFSASLSTLSAVINSLSATIYEDFLSYFIARGTSDKTISNYLKILAVIIGVICTGLVFIVPYLGSILPLALSVSGVVNGTVMGIFICGMFIPTTNSIGTLWGGILSLGVMSWIVFGSQYYKSAQVIIYPTLPLSISGCSNLTSVDMPRETEFHKFSEDEPFILYKISFYYYWLLGILIVIIVGYVLSKCTVRYNKPIAKELFSPLIRSMLLPNQAPEYYKMTQLTRSSYSNEKNPNLLYNQDEHDNQK